MRILFTFTDFYYYLSKRLLHVGPLHIANMTLLVKSKSGRNAEHSREMALHRRE